ncbi:hypothetical protein [Streptomyces sp. 900105245]
MAVTCRVRKLARQPYYRWIDKPVPTPCWAHRDDPGFGSRFLADEARGAGARMADRTAWRICRDNR